MKEFPFPSLSLLKNITEGQVDAVKCAKSLKSQGVISEDIVLTFNEGQVDAVKCAKSLKSQGVISEDIVLTFNEMYLQKCEEF